MAKPHRFGNSPECQASRPRSIPFSVVTAQPDDLPDTPLYHYTDSAGLLGILGRPVTFKGTLKGTTHGTLWATDARYLNDSEEVTYGSNSLVKALRRTAEVPHYSSAVKSHLQQLADDVKQSRYGMEWHEDARDASPYVTCLCENGDLLSQWRGYGAGGGGYAIGFSPAVLRKFSTVNASLIAKDTNFEHASTPILNGPRKVVYGRKGTRDFMIDFARKTADALTAGEARNESYPWDILRLEALTTLAHVKHKAFREENEWRFVEHDAGMEQPEFRAGGIGLIPYMKLYFPITDGTYDEPAITEIVVGPGGNRELRAKALERLLHKIGSPDTRVRLSEAPFRG